MAEAVRRFRETSGSDVVRRLIARPIRLDPPRSPVSLSFARPVSDWTQERMDERMDERPDDALPVTAYEVAAVEDVEDAAFDDEPEEAGVLERLQAEMALMKAVMMAERAEAASLRARFAQHVEPEPIGAEARATRDRWAGMVDRLLLSAR